MLRLGRDTVWRDLRATEYFYGYVVAVIVAAGIIEDSNFLLICHLVDACSTACSDYGNARRVADLFIYLKTQ